MKERSAVIGEHSWVEAVINRVQKGGPQHRCEGHPRGKRTVHPHDRTGIRRDRAGQLRDAEGHWDAPYEGNKAEKENRHERAAGAHGILQTVAAADAGGVDDTEQGEGGEDGFRANLRIRARAAEAHDRRRTAAAGGRQRRPLVLSAQHYVIELDLPFNYARLNQWDTRATNASQEKHDNELVRTKKKKPKKLPVSCVAQAETTTVLTG